MAKKGVEATIVTVEVGRSDSWAGSVWKTDVIGCLSRMRIAAGELGDLGGRLTGV